MTDLKSLADALKADTARLLKMRGPRIGDGINEGVNDGACALLLADRCLKAESVLRTLADADAKMPTLHLSDAQTAMLFGSGDTHELVRRTDALGAVAAAMGNEKTNPWKAAVIDELVVAHILTAEHETNPRKAVKDAISWNCQVVLDPLVSSGAANLIAEATERAEKAEKDAARYRWLRKASGEAWLNVMQTDPDGCDAAIDQHLESK
jgi:hypothetical protein